MKDPASVLRLREKNLTLKRHSDSGRGGTLGPGTPPGRSSHTHESGGVITTPAAAGRQACTRPSLSGEKSRHRLLSTDFRVRGVHSSYGKVFYTRSNAHVISRFQAFSDVLPSLFKTGRKCLNNG